jgi:acetyl esterase/lipase
MMVVPVAGEEPSELSPPSSFVYKKTDQAELRLAIHYPAKWQATDKRPAIVFFFGGGWSSGKLEQFVPQATAMAARGMMAMRADYRVKSRHGITPRECVEDAKSAVRWIRSHAAELGIDPERIVAAGGSAGGHLAACTALTPGLDAADENLQVSSRPNALVLFNPVLRFTDVPELMARIGRDEKLGKAISPVLHLAEDSPPAIVFFGSVDKLAPMGDEFLKQSREVGCRVELAVTEGQSHGFFNRSPWREQTTRKMDAFLVSLGYLPPLGSDAGRLGKDWLETLQITTSKAEDRVEPRVEAGTLTLNIFSPSGIGRATITSPQGTWPERVQLRVHLAGLEHVEISNGSLRLTGEYSSHGAGPAELHSSEADVNTASKVEFPITARNATGQPVSELPGKDGYFEIGLPGEVLADQSKTLEVQWIDFYRG